MHVDRKESDQDRPPCVAENRRSDLVMSGAMAKMMPAEPGSRFDVDFGAFGSVSIGFAK
jgi:hypothetical protein